jgi:hypothetical protein
MIYSEFLRIEHLGVHGIVAQKRPAVSYIARRGKNPHIAYPSFSVYPRQIDTEVQSQDELPPEEPQLGIVVTSAGSGPVTLSVAQFEVGAYFEFLYGWGAGPGVDLGAVGTYTKVRTVTGSVYRQNFERGICLGNLGDEAAVVVLEHRYLDLMGNVHTSVTVPARAVKVLIKDI